MSTLSELLAAADARRADLVARLATEETDTYRLFHGSAEGRPGLTIDRYGDALLLQTFHTPLSDDEHATILAHYAPLGLAACYNDRSGANSRIGNRLPETSWKPPRRRASSASWA